MKEVKLVNHLQSAANNLVIPIGIGFAFAGASKLMDPYLAERLTNDSLFAVSILLDLFVGCALISMPKSKSSRLAGLIVSIVYLGFLIRGVLLGVWTCDCFGSDSSIYLSMTFDSVAIISLAFSLSCSESTTKLQPAEMVFYVALVGVVFGLGIAVNQVSLRGDLRFEAARSDASHKESVIEEGKWKGNIVLRNRAKKALRIVGISNNCQFDCSSSLPVTLLPDSSQNLKVSVSVPKSKHREKFTSGTAKLFVEFDSPSKPQLTEIEVPWGVFLF